MAVTSSEWSDKSEQSADELVQYMFDDDGDDDVPDWQRRYTALDESVKPPRVIRTRCPPESSVIAVFTRYSTHGYVAVQLSDGRMLKYIPASVTVDEPRLLVENALGTFPTPCPRFCVTEMAGTESILGLDARSRMYVDQTLISPQCLSFTVHVHSRFVAFTVGGRQNAMFFLDTEKTLQQNVEDRTNPHIVRFTERGSSIVTVIASRVRPRVIVQLPRGNLEAVFPRALTLHSINKSLSQRNYRMALCTMRTNRVDMNLLYDHDPVDFLNHVHEFVRQLNNPDFINLFLSSLKNMDVLQTQYAGYEPIPFRADQRTSAHNVTSQHTDDMASERTHKHVSSGGAHETQEERAQLAESLRVGSDRSGSARDRGMHPEHAKFLKRQEFMRAANCGGADGEHDQFSVAPEALSRVKSRPPIDTKVTVVCDTVCAALMSADPDRLALCVITALVKRQPPDLEQSLRFIGRIRHREANVSTDIPRPRVSCKQAIKYLLVLEDVNALFDVALGMYDFDLVLLVAEFSQKDPREYMPFLGRLREMPESLRRYTIDVHLGRFDRALRHIADAGAEHFDKFLDLVRRHALYSTALELLNFPASCVPGSSSSSHRRTQHALRLEMLGARIHGFEDTATRTDCSLLETQWTQVMTMYGAWLMEPEQNQSLQAALVYGACGAWPEALRAYQHAGCWRECMSVAARLGLSEEKTRKCAYEMASILQKLHQSAEAARVLVEYCGDVDEAVALLMRSGDWNEAVRLVCAGKRDDLLDAHVLPGIADAYAHRLREIHKRSKQYLYSIGRLRIVRRSKLMRPELAMDPIEAALAERGVFMGHRLLDTGRDDGDESRSLFSEFSTFSGTSTLSSTSSVFTVDTQTTGVSQASSASSVLSVKQLRYLKKKKKKAKRTRAVEGSAYEEEHVLSSLRSLTPSLPYKQQVMRLTRALLLCNMLGEAQKLQCALGEFIRKCVEQENLPMPVPLRNHAVAVHKQDMHLQQQYRVAAKWNWPMEIYSAPPVSKMLHQIGEDANVAQWRTVALVRNAVSRDSSSVVPPVVVSDSNTTRTTTDGDDDDDDDVDDDMDIGLAMLLS